MKLSFIFLKPTEFTGTLLVFMLFSNKPVQVIGNSYVQILLWLSNID